jgi:SAM-dependent methyltransferase
VLDVGGGSGRYALPLALHCRHVTVVEQSPRMAAALADSARQAGIDNVTLVPSAWQDAVVEPADVVLCANVLYDVAEVKAFVRKLAGHARGRLLLHLMQSPLSRFADLWQAVHGEARVNLPATPELLAVLWQMDLWPDLHMVAVTPPESAPDRETTLAFLRAVLYTRPDSKQDGRLLAALPVWLEESPAGVRLRGDHPRRHALLTLPGAG